jgi:phosphinothricin acetyltransferase
MRGETMECSIVPLTTGDRKAVIDIFNYYVEHSFAAYTEKKLAYHDFEMLIQRSSGYPAGALKDEQDNTIGFGMLRSHNPIPAFSRTAEVTYFILPENTGKGLGTMLLAFLEREARQKRITNLLATISSFNPASIRFHEKNGFKACGRFEKVGEKNGYLFDTLWMQKFL